MQRFNGDVPTTNTVFAAGGHHTTPTKPHLHILHSIFQSPLTYITWYFSIPTYIYYIVFLGLQLYRIWSLNHGGITAFSLLSSIFCHISNNDISFGDINLEQIFFIEKQMITGIYKCEKILNKARHVIMCDSHI